jgi:hypothetical protein
MGRILRCAHLGMTTDIIHEIEEKEPNNMEIHTGLKIRTGLKAGQGLGDTVADLAHLTGMDQMAKLYEQTTGKSCGCEQRRQALNQYFPFGQSS